MTEALDTIRLALRGERAWLVGGAVRDRLAGRPVADIDLVLDGDVRHAARHLAVAVGGPAFELSNEFGAWRVIGPGREFQVDITRLSGATLEDDLAQRDFTVNAIAEPLAGGPLVDPHDGALALAERRLTMVSPASFDADPLRVLRLARFACELGLVADKATLAAACKRAARIADVAAERVFAELRRVVVADAVLDGLALIDDLELTAHVLPEIEALRGVEQNRYHHRDVHGHTLEVLAAVVDLERDPAAALGAGFSDEIAAVLAEPLADELTRGGALRLGALLHDIAKPVTRTVLGDGRVGFPGHDTLGAEMTRGALTRLRASERLGAHVAALTRHHLRLGFLVKQAPLGARELHRYLVGTAPVEIDVTLLSVADRLATRGENAERAIERHVDLARAVLRAGLDRRAAGVIAPLVRGDELSRALGVRGRRIGELLAQIEEARYAGEVASAAEAVALARSLLAGGG